MQQGLGNNYALVPLVLYVYLCVAGIDLRTIYVWLDWLEYGVDLRTILSG